MEQVNKPLTEKTSRSSIKQAVRCKRDASGSSRVGSGCTGSCEQSNPFIKKQQVFANAGNPKCPELSEPKHVPLQAT